MRRSINAGLSMILALGFAKAQGPPPFPCWIGDKWCYAYNSTFDGKGYVVREVVDLSPSWFWKVSVTTHLVGSTRAVTEYWYNQGGRFYISNSSSIPFFPAFIDSLAHDSTYWGSFESSSWKLTQATLFGVPYSAQSNRQEFFAHPNLSLRTFGVGRGVGLYYVERFYRSGVSVTANDTSSLIGLYINGFLIGDTTRALVSVDENPMIPRTFDVMQNFPNPFNPTTTIRLTLPSEGDVSIAVLDCLGRVVSRARRQFSSNGVYDLSFDGSMLSSGVYFYRTNFKGKYRTIKMILTK